MFLFIHKENSTRRTIS